jgi:hypothetical protein
MPRLLSLALAFALSAPLAIAILHQGAQILA